MGGKIVVISGNFIGVPMPIRNQTTSGRIIEKSN
jgi:hypothetical protein